VFHELAPAVVREEPEFDCAQEPLHREAYEPKDRPHRLTVEIENPIES
jgi:hypothetical protein